MFCINLNFISGIDIRAMIKFSSEVSGFFKVFFLSAISQKLIILHIQNKLYLRALILLS